ncbi:MAG: hypothetical protein QME85_01670 [Candidatus Saccharicenans sp.]|nr:hypothetical protein [Candidatus Saccharicenans sp.]
MKLELPFGARLLANGNLSGMRLPDSLAGRNFLKNRRRKSELADDNRSSGASISFEPVSKITESYPGNERESPTA